MTEQHTSIKNIEEKQGRVTVTLHARSYHHAHRAVDWVERNPIRCWPMIWNSVARRQRGGKLRVLKLCFYFTGEASADHVNWHEALRDVDRIAGTPTASGAT